MFAFAQFAHAAIPDGTLASCNSVAALFDNTCSSAGVDDGATVSCTGEMRCPGTSGSATYTDSSPCTFTRKLCVTCAETNGQVRVTVSGNGLPNHCFFSTVNVAEAMENEWSAVWNPDVSNIMNYTSEDFNSSEKTDEILCDLQRTSSSNMNSASDY